MSVIIDETDAGQGASEGGNASEEVLTRSEGQPAPDHEKVPMGKATGELAAALRQDPRFMDRKEEYLDKLAREARDATGGRFTAGKLVERAEARARGEEPPMTTQMPAPQMVRQRAVTPTKAGASAPSEDIIPMVSWWTIVPVILGFLAMIAAAIYTAVSAGLFRLG